MSQQKEVSQFKVLLLDIYGTLIDRDTGIHRALKPLITKVRPTWSRREALTAFEAVEKDLKGRDPGVSYAELVVTAHKEFKRRLLAAEGAARLEEESNTGAADPSTSASGAVANVASSRVEGLEEGGEEDTFGRSIDSWPVYPAVLDALPTLSHAFSLVALSPTVDRASFEHTRRYIEHGFAFKEVVTAEDVLGGDGEGNVGRAVKIVETRLGVKREDILFVTSKPAELTGVGVASALIWKRNEGDKGSGGEEGQSFRFDTLGQMADEVLREKWSG